jgi:branched-chain amino acid transport system permease protein
VSFTDQLLQLCLTGWTNGAIYALIAVGFVVIYNVTGVLNFAQGEFTMLGAMVAAVLAKAGTPLPLALLVAIALAVLVGVLMERLAIHPARKAGPLTLIVITIGVGILIRGLALIAWGTEGRSLAPLIGGAPLRILTASLQRQALLVIATSLAAVGGLHLFFNKTVLGLAVRASVMNRMAARLMGVAPDRMSVLAFAISAGMGALAGVLIAPLQTAIYDMGLMLGLKGFVAAVLGGLTNAPASILGGLVLGVVESLTAGLLSSAYRDAIAFLLLVTMLFVRPTGLLGKATGKRV